MKSKSIQLGHHILPHEPFSNLYPNFYSFPASYNKFILGMCGINSWNKKTIALFSIFFGECGAICSVMTLDISFFIGKGSFYVREKYKEKFIFDC